MTKSMPEIFLRRALEGIATSPLNWSNFQVSSGQQQRRCNLAEVSYCVAQAASIAYSHGAVSSVFAVGALQHPVAMGPFALCRRRSLQLSTIGACRW